MPLLAAVAVMRRRPRFARRLQLALLATVFTVAVIEAIAFVALKAIGAYPAESFRDQYATSSCLKGNEFNYGKYARSQQDMQVMMGKTPHPFFGITVNQEGGDLEFRRHEVGPDYENLLRYSIDLGRDPRPKNTFTIGIFGASVAVSFAQHVLQNDDFAAALRQRIPSLGDREIVIRNMGVGASRQPSQLAIAIHYMELFDMTINLDGYSEQAIVMYPEYPIEYPMFGDVFFDKNGASRYLQLLSAEYVCKGISGLGQLPLLRDSNAYYLLWYLASASMKRTVQVRGHETPAALVENYPFTEDEVRRLYAAYYERYTRYQHQVLEANGVHAYFFLQPNQYVPDSKPFSEEEQRSAVNAGARDETAARYALLKEEIRKLAAEGVPAFDLTTTFAQTRETVYIDNCCHVNDHGNDLIAAAIVDAVAREENARAARSKQ